jgi:uncharacterized protein
MQMARSGGVLAALGLCTVVAPPVAAQLRPGFDCTKAGTAVDRLICSHEPLAGQDRALADRYEQLRQGISPEGFAVLRKDQRTWLTSRNDCMAKDQNHDAAVACLSESYTSRIDELRKEFRSAGGLSIEKRDVERHLARLRVDESDIYPWLVAKPQARADAFNGYVAQRLQLAKGQFAASGIKLDPRPPDDTTFSRYYEINGFDDRLISIEFFQFHESYFGHGWRSEFAINWDLGRGRPLRLVDLFRSDKDWKQVTYDFAMKSLREGDMHEPEQFFDAAQVDDDEAWLFDDDGATLLLGHGERSMVGASAVVSIPYDVLQPFLRPDAPIPMSGK